MAQIPPDIDVTNPDKFTEWLNVYQKGLWAACQNIDNTAIFLHKGMVEALIMEGLDQPGRFNFGAGSASKAAGTVSSKLRKASQHLNAAIILMKGAKAAAEKNVDAPIAAARDARKRAKSSYSV
jgi:hypothetical protein